MPTYDFVKLKTDLTEAVINAYMRRAAPWITDGSCREGKFDYKQPPNRYGAEATIFYVTYPGGQWREDGGLIGDDSSAPYEPFDARSAYAEIEAWIDSWVDPFIDAPQPADFDDQIRILQWAAEKLSVGGEVRISGGGSLTRIDAGNEEVPVYIETIRSELSDLNGVAVKTLRDYYGGKRVADVMSGQYALAVVAGTLVAGEKAMWKQLQQDLSQLLDFGADSFNQFAEDNEISPGEYIDMVDAVTDAAGLFALPVGAAKAIGNVTKISTIVKHFMPAEPAKISYEIKGGSFEAMASSLTDALSDLSTSVFRTEQAFTDCARAANDELDANMGAFDNLRPVEFLKSGEDGIYNDANGVHGNEAVINDALKTVASRYELVADHCRDVAKRLDLAANPSPWRRPRSVGKTDEGHYPEYEALVLGLARLLKNASREMHDVGEKCLLVLADFKATDEDIRRRLNRLAEGVEADVKSHVNR